MPGRGSGAPKCCLQAGHSSSDLSFGCEPAASPERVNLCKHRRVGRMWVHRPSAGGRDRAMAHREPKQRRGSGFCSATASCHTVPAGNVLGGAEMCMGQIIIKYREHRRELPAQRHCSEQVLLSPTAKLGMQNLLGSQKHNAACPGGSVEAGVLSPGCGMGQLHTERNQEHSLDFPRPESSAGSSLKEWFVIVEGSLKAILELLGHDKVISGGKSARSLPPAGHHSAI